MAKHKQRRATATSDPSILQTRVERLLAGYIGPIAKHLVKTAALRVATAEQLVSMVAAELETETDRHEFTRRWRTGAPQNR